jgi:hypothetical protein
MEAAAHTVEVFEHDRKERMQVTQAIKG